MVDVLRDGVVTPVQVQTGITDGINTQIVSGLAAGDRVVTGVASSDDRSGEHDVRDVEHPRRRRCGAAPAAARCRCQMIHRSFAGTSYDTTTTGSSTQITQETHMTSPIRSIKRLAAGSALAVGLFFLPQSLAMAQDTGSTPDASRTFADTGYTVSDDAIWSFFSQYGGVNTFGEPISREFMLFGNPVQVFQDAALQVQPDGTVQAMQLTDPGLVPTTQLTGVNVPPADAAVAFVTPTPDQPNYRRSTAGVLAEHGAGRVERAERRVRFDVHELTAGPPSGDCRRRCPRLIPTTRALSTSASRTGFCSTTHRPAPPSRCPWASTSNSSSPRTRHSLRPRR